MLPQVNLQCLDEVVPHNTDPESATYRSQKERLERNEFFKECLAPPVLVLKVHQNAWHGCTNACLQEIKITRNLCSAHLLTRSTDTWQKERSKQASCKALT